MHDLEEHSGGGRSALCLTGTCLRKGCHCHQVQCMLYVGPHEEHNSRLGQVTCVSFLTACMMHTFCTTKCSSSSVSLCQCCCILERHGLLCKNPLALWLSFRQTACNASVASPAKGQDIDQVQHLYCGVSAAKQKTQVARSHFQDAS